MLDQYVPNLKKYKAIVVDIGEKDTLLARNHLLASRLKRFGVPHAFTTHEVDHNGHVMIRLEQKILPFFAQQLSFEQGRQTRR